MNWLLFLVFLAAAVIVAIAGAIIGFGSAAVYLVLAVLVVLALTVQLVLMRHTQGRAAAGGGDGVLPSAHIEADGETPLGDSPELHDEIVPHDLPRDHPGRQAAEEQAASGGTTRGHV